MGHHSKSHRKRDRSKSPSDRKKHKHRHRHHRADKGEVKVEPNPRIPQLTEEDYFSHNVELRVWLRESAGVFFHDLSTDDAHRHFTRFMQEWNTGKLDRKYYSDQLRYSEIDSATRSSHHWNLKNVDDWELSTIRDRVGTDSTRSSEVTQSKPNRAAPAPVSVRRLGPTLPEGMRPPEDAVDREEREQKETLARQKERRDVRHEREDVLDELLPRATGRDAMIEKKRVKNSERRAREESPEPRISERDLMGATDGDFKTMLARQKERERQKYEQKNRGLADRMAAYQAREDESMAQFRELVAQSGGIKIQKRD